MTVISGLSLPLKAVGKRIKGWDESGDCLQVEVSVAIRRAAIPSCWLRSSQVHGPAGWAVTEPTGAPARAE